jgi:hypothetical protein
MSRRGEIVVECDYAHCHAEQIYAPSDLEDFGLAACMSDDGWVERDGRYICAQCVAESTPEPTETRP